MFGWKESYALGVPHIDAQHKQLFEIIAELHQAMLTAQSKAILGRTLEKLIDYTARHFSAEETLLRSRNYSELTQHKAVHDQFTARMRKFQDDHKSGALMVNVELMNVLQRWLIDHIQGTDTRYAHELKLRA